MRTIFAATALAALALTGCGSTPVEAPAPAPTHLPGWGVSDGTLPRPPADGPSLLDCTVASPCSGSAGTVGEIPDGTTGGGGTGGTYGESR